MSIYKTGSFKDTHLSDSPLFNLKTRPPAAQKCPTVPLIDSKTSVSNSDIPSFLNQKHLLSTQKPLPFILLGHAHLTHLKQTPMFHSVQLKGESLSPT